MRTKKFFLAACITGCTFLSIALCAQQNDSSLALQAAPHLVSSQFIFTEGASVDKKGNVFFTDQPNNKIWKYDTDGKLSVFKDSAGRSNGMYFDKKGNLITCADERNQLWSIDPKGKVTVLLQDFEGHMLNGPNDIWIDPKGGMYFTDPYYKRDYWQRRNMDIEVGGEKVYFIAKGKMTPVVVDETVKKPNGIVGTPDGKFLYVSDIGARKIYKYTINKDGSLSDRILFAEELSDGMTLDNRGNLYLAGNGVSIYNPSGKKIQQIKVPSNKWVGNLAFGGKKKNILFITASESVYILPMKVRGVE